MSTAAKTGTNRELRKTPKTSHRTRQAKSRDAPALVDDVEIISAVCRWFCEGYKPASIADKANSAFPGIHMTREVPYAILQKAGRKGWLQFCPPQHARHRELLRERCAWLGGIEVPHTATVADVAFTAAKELLRLLRSRRAEEVHIGFAGGHSMRELAKALARLLCEPHSDLPKTIWFHALATGFDPEDPTTNPNAFFTYFLNEGVTDVKFRFHGLSAPSMVHPRALAGLKKLDDIRLAFEAVQNLDIIVTSGSSWNDEDSALLRRMRESRDSVKILDGADCIGDILWRPLGPRGPIETVTDLRALTLVDLQELPSFIKSGKRVLLMLAPCGKCHAPKGELLASVLNQDQPLITDLVVDSVSVRQMLSRETPAGLN